MNLLLLAEAAASTLEWLDVVILLSFVVYAIWSGISSSGVASESLEEYFLAGRSLPGWKAGLSMAATQFAADTPLLITGIIATSGIFFIWQQWIYALAFLMMGFVLAPSWRRAGVLTDAELTELRYGSGAATALRGIKAIYFGTVFNCVVLGWVLYATSIIAEPFLLWDQWIPSVHGLFSGLVEAIHVPLTTAEVNLSVLEAATDDASKAALAEVWANSTNNFMSILILVLVTTFYSASGGLRSVVATDVFQFGVAMLGTALYAGFVIYECGGLGPMLEGVREIFADGGPAGVDRTADQILAFTPSQAKGVTGALIAAFALQWLIQLNADGTGYLAQRSMACKSDADAKQAAIVFTFAQVIVRSLLWLPIGLGLLVLIKFAPESLAGIEPDHQVEAYRKLREATFVTGIKDLLPMGLRGLMLTAMLAALASTIDTHLNWGSSYWTNDIYKRLWCQGYKKVEPDPKKLVWIARAANLLILGLSMVVMTQLTSINTAWQIALLLGAGMGVMLVLRWLWWGVTAWGELATIGVSLVIAVPLFLFVTDELVGEGVATPLRLLLMALLCTAAGVGVSLQTPEDPARLRAFFRLAQPPGWWGEIAKDCGADPQANVRRLGFMVGAMFSAALCVFCFLVGIGSALIGSPAPTWWPLPWALWVAFNLVGGAALIPVWLKLGFGPEATELPLGGSADTPVLSVGPTDVGRISQLGLVETLEDEADDPSPVAADEAPEPPVADSSTAAENADDPDEPDR